MKVVDQQINIIFSLIGEILLTLGMESMTHVHIAHFILNYLLINFIKTNKNEKIIWKLFDFKR